MMNDIGFFAITLENNQLHEQICNMINEYIQSNKNRHIVLFNQYSEKIDTKHIPILPLSHSKYFDGDLVTFDIHSLLIATSSIKANNVFFYAQSAPWEISYNSYENWKKVFQHNKLKIITRNQYLHDIYNIAWNNSIGTCEEISHEQFSKFL